MPPPRLPRPSPRVAWWEAYGDPVLSDLIRRAARENRDVRIAAQRVQAARAGVTISRSLLVPSVGVSARAATPARIRTAPQAGLPDIKTRQRGVEVSWEIDLSGRLRAGARAAAADAWPPRTASAPCGCWS
jgi:multidrug efflux system outer membrane protein